VIAGQGDVYRPSEHLSGREVPSTVSAAIPRPRSHVRRLEALRRVGHAKRIDADRWRVPTDLPERGQAYDLARDRTNIRISILSPTGLDSQIGHDGATWLDRELASSSRTTLANTGFGREVSEAIERRRQSLVNMGRRPAGGRTYPCVKGFYRQSGAYGGHSCRQGHGCRTRSDVHRRQDRRIRQRHACRLHSARQRPLRHDR